MNIFSSSLKNQQEKTKLLQAHSALFTTMLEKLNLLTEDRQIMHPTMNFRGPFPPYPPFPLPLTQEPITQPPDHRHNPMEVEVDLKRKAPSEPMINTPRSDCDPMEEQASQEQQTACEQQKIREKPNDKTTLPPNISEGRMA